MLHGNAQTHLVFFLLRETAVPQISGDPDGQPCLRPFTDQTLLRPERIYHRRYGQGCCRPSGQPAYRCLASFWGSVTAPISLWNSPPFSRHGQSPSLQSAGTVPPDGLLLPVRLFFRAKYRICRAAANQKLTHFSSAFSGQLLPAPAAAYRAPLPFPADHRRTAAGHPGTGTSHCRNPGSCEGFSLPVHGTADSAGTAAPWSKAAHTSMFVHKSFYLRVIRHFCRQYKMVTIPSSLCRCPGR